MVFRIARRERIVYCIEVRFLDKCVKIGVDNKIELSTPILIYITLFNYVV